MIARFIILACCLWAAPTQAQSGEPQPANAPSFNLNSTQGRVVEFNSGRQTRPALILFWATWCPYCRALMPEIQKVRDLYADTQLDLFAIHIFDQDGDPVAYMKKYGYTYQLLFDGDEVAGAYGVKGTPGLFLVAPDGHIAYKRISGTEPEQARLAIIEAMTELEMALPSSD